MLKSNHRLSAIAAGLTALATCLGTFTIAGCERKERVIDIQTPAGDVKVDRNIDSGKVEVNTNHN